MAKNTVHSIIQLSWGVYICAIIFTSLLPSKYIPETDISDKILHLIAYVPLGIFPGLTHRSGKWIYISAITMVFLGIALEIGQIYSPGRFFSFGDIIANGIGVGVGVVIVISVMRRAESD